MNRFVKTAAISTFALSVVGGAAFAQSNDDDPRANLITCSTFLDLNQGGQTSVANDLMLMIMDGDSENMNLEDTATIDENVSFLVEACQGREPNRVLRVALEAMDM